MIKMRSDIIIVLILTAVIVPLCTSQSGERPTPVRKSAYPSFMSVLLDSFVFWYIIWFNVWKHVMHSTFSNPWRPTQAAQILLCQTPSGQMTSVRNSWCNSVLYVCLMTIRWQEDGKTFIRDLSLGETDIRNPLVKINHCLHRHCAFAHAVTCGYVRICLSPSLLKRSCFLTNSCFLKCEWAV